MRLLEVSQNTHLRLMFAASMLLPLNAQKLTVRTVSHARSEYVYTVSDPQTTNTNCRVYENNVNCQSQTNGGGSENKAVYHFSEVVVADDGAGGLTQYTLTRTARWIWNAMDWLVDGMDFPAEIRGKFMYITSHRGGNQGKRVTLKYSIVDIRPVEAPTSQPPSLNVAERPTPTLLKAANPEPQDSKIAAEPLIEKAMIRIESAPEGAEIYLNDRLIGTTPSTIPMQPGVVRFIIKKSGFAPWVRDMEAMGGASQTLRAELQPDR